MKEEIYGAFNDISNLSTDINHLKVSFYTSLVEHKWEYCGQIADSIGNLLSHNYPKTNSSLANELSIISNELLENASRFSLYSSDSSISIEVFASPQNVKFSVTNLMTYQMYLSLKANLDELYDPATNYSKKYFERLEEIAEKKEEKSGIGLLMILKDYPIQLGIKISGLQENLFMAEFQVYYNLDILNPEWFSE
jgi:hypothetical protein